MKTIRAILIYELEVPEDTDIIDIQEAFDTEEGREGLSVNVPGTDSEISFRFKEAVVATAATISTDNYFKVMM